MKVQSPTQDYLSPVSKVAAQNNYNVTLVDLDPTIIEKAKKSIAKNLDRVAKKQFKDDQAAATAFVEGAINRISGSTDVLETAKNTDLVIEAIVEKLEVKQKLFASIDAVSCKVQKENANLIKGSRENTNF